MLHEMPLPNTTISLSGARHCSIGRLYERSFNNLSWHFFDWGGSFHGFQRLDAKMFALDIVKSNKSVEKAMEKIRLGMRKLRNSSFYENFMEHMRDPEMVRRIKNVTGTDPYHSELQVVIRGIGMAKPSNHMQIAFLILLRHKFY